MHNSTLTGSDQNYVYSHKGALDSFKHALIFLAFLARSFDARTKHKKTKQETMRDMRFPTFFILLCTPFYKTGWLNELGSWIT